MSSTTATPVDRRPWCEQKGDPEWAIKAWTHFMKIRHLEEIFGMTKLNGFVYFIQAGNSRGPVKIGYSAENIKGRLSNLQVGNPYKLHLLAQAWASRRGEEALHQWFKDYRMQGEWFRGTAYGLPELIDHLSERLAV